MNDYIFDWAENSEKILNGEGYTTKVHQTFEQIMLFCYLREKGYNKEQIFDAWIKTDSLLLQKIGDDKDQRDKYFGKLLADSTKYKIEKGNEIKIYQSEIDFINKMEVSMWIKQYVLTMLCIYKWYGREWCVYNDKIKRFCYSCTSTKIERDRNTYKLSEALLKYKPYLINSRNNFLSFKMLMEVDGNVLINIVEPRKIIEYFYFLNRKKICSLCGNEFNYKDNSIELTECPDCRKKIRYKRQYNNIVSRGGSEKSYNSENRLI